MEAIPYLLAPLIIPIVLLYVMFVFLTWIANPLFNTFLRFHPFGQHLLDRSQRWASNLIAPSLMLSLVGLFYGCYRGNLLLACLAAAYWLGMAIPISATFLMPTRERRWLVAAASVAVAGLPVVGAFRSVWAQSPEPLYFGFQYFAFGLLAIQVGGNLIAMKPVQSSGIAGSGWWSILTRSVSEARVLANAPLTLWARNLASRPPIWCSWEIDALNVRIRFFLTPGSYALPSVHRGLNQNPLQAESVRVSDCRGGPSDSIGGCIRNRLCFAKGPPADVRILHRLSFRPGLRGTTRPRIAWAGADRETPRRLAPCRPRPD